MDYKMCSFFHVTYLNIWFLVNIGWTLGCGLFASGLCFSVVNNLFKRALLNRLQIPAIPLDKSSLLPLYVRQFRGSPAKPSNVPVFHDMILAHLSPEGTTTLSISGNDEIAGLRTHPVHNMSVMTLDAARRLRLDSFILGGLEKTFFLGLKYKEAAHIDGYVPGVPVLWQKLKTEIDFYITTETMKPDISIGLEVLLNNKLCQFFSQDTERRGESYITGPHPYVSPLTCERVQNPELVIDAKFQEFDRNVYSTKIAVSGRSQNIILTTFLKDNAVGFSHWIFQRPAKPKGLALVVDRDDLIDSIVVRKPVFKNSVPYIKDTGISFTLGITFLAENCSVIDYGRKILFLRNESGELIPIKLQVLSL